MTINYTYLYLLSPLHTGGTTQEGNLLGIARESHTNFPYIPSSSIRGRLRAGVATKNKNSSFLVRIWKMPVNWNKGLFGLAMVLYSGFPFLHSVMELFG